MEAGTTAVQPAAESLSLRIAGRARSRRDHSGGPVFYGCRDLKFRTGSRRWKNVGHGGITTMFREESIHQYHC